ncbi:hypothetical protein [Streptodolium elevatio]
MTARTLEDLGLARTPSLEPLTYPGTPLTHPALLRGDHLLPITPDSTPVGEWAVEVGDGRRTALDTALAVLGEPRMHERVPVLAIGSHAAPAQLRHKLRTSGLPGTVPLTLATLRGIRIGFSAHVSPAGYVAASPYVDAEATPELIVTWLDTVQLKAVDDTEYPEYRRVVLPERRFPVAHPSGETLFGVHLYVNAKGVLAHPDGRTPTPLLPQPEILRRLCAASPELAERLGDSPEEFVHRARADADLREFGTRLFAEAGWLLSQPELDALPDARDSAPPM